MEQTDRATEARIEEACWDITDYQRRARYLGQKRGRFENTAGQYLGLLLWLPMGMLVCCQLPNPIVALMLYFAVLSPGGAISL